MTQQFSEPSVKGSIFVLATEALRGLIDGDVISTEDVEARLDARDLVYLDEKILTGCWYPISSFARIASFAVDNLPFDPSDILVEQGAIAADRLLESQAYSSFKTEIEKRGEQAGIAMLSFARLIFNFGDWSLDQSELDSAGKFILVAEDMEPLSDLLVCTTQGFITRLSSLMAGGPTYVKSQRPTRDRVLFEGGRIDRPS